ncbi:hypothetical protein V492_03754, partial [Pseudogymnoascus sp. VKM F-4246]
PAVPTSSAAAASGPLDAAGPSSAPVSPSRKRKSPSPPADTDSDTDTNTDADIDTNSSSDSGSDSSAGSPATQTRTHTRNSTWTEREKDALVDVMTAYAAGVAAGTRPAVFDVALWGMVQAELRTGHGVDRKAQACRMTWGRGLRERTGIDERSRKDPKRMATSVQKKAGRRCDEDSTMATDMDIDMGLDLDIGQDYSNIDVEQDTQIELHPDLSAAPISTDPTDPASTVVTPNKIHLRGLDDLTTKDIKSFAEEYSAGQPYERVEWIDDTSANILYSSPEAASAALQTFVATEQLPASHSTLDMLPAKPFPNFPNTRLTVRLAVEGDKKQPGARERSRFYLLNPEHEPQERRSRDDRGRRGDGRNRSRRDNYRRRDYDDREPRRRSDDFDASMYDDEPSARGSESESGTSGYRTQRSQRVRFAGVGKELFPEKITSRSSGRLRNRSASPRRDNEGDLILDARPSDSRGGRARSGNDGGANRRKAQLIKERLKASASEPLELFPRKAGARAGNEAVDPTADLFADKLRIPMMDGANDRLSPKPDLMSRITKPGASDADSQSSFKIRGTAKQPSQEGFSIKGLAGSGQGGRELFPGKAGGNAGKELFADRLEGRGGRRQRAEDTFH